MKRGTHVDFVPGAGEEAVIGHFLKHNDDGTDAIQTNDGVENVPQREPTPGHQHEDLGRTWHLID